MKRYQAHIALAAMAGDPIEILGSPVASIPDGVRYSRRVRDIYLYRAMLAFMEDVVQQTAPLPRTQADEVWGKMFPTMLVDDNLGPVTGTRTQGLLTRKPVRILSVATRTTTPTPFRDSTQRLLQGRLNTINQQSFDPSYTMFAPVSPDVAIVELYAPTAFVTAYGSDDVHCLYVPTPLNPEDQDPEDELDFEPFYLNGIINRANMMAHQDNQDPMGAQ